LDKALKNTICGCMQPANWCRTSSNVK